MEKQFYRVSEVAEMTGLAIATIRKKVMLRQIGYHKKVRAVFIPKSEVQKLLGEYRPPVDAA